ncbi:MAG: hypothetical protein M5U34_48755 [Chloroflexi bacterium]|nr:hypothetical protein [Chloroflexota bacterium]
MAAGFGLMALALTLLLTPAGLSLWLRLMAGLLEGWGGNGRAPSSAISAPAKRCPPKKRSCKLPAWKPFPGAPPPLCLLTRRSENVFER